MSPDSFVTYLPDRSLVEVLKPPGPQRARHDRRHSILKPPGQEKDWHEDYEEAHKIVRDPSSGDGFADRSPLNGTVRMSDSRDGTDHRTDQLADCYENEERDRADR